MTNHKSKTDDPEKASVVTCEDPPNVVRNGEDSNAERELDYTQIKEALKELLLDPDFEKIENTASEFNVFETLRSTQGELKHSNVIAWLCDPNENHGFGSLFIRYLLRYILKDEDLKRDIIDDEQNGSDTIECFDLFQLDEVDLELVEVHREKKNIDILVTIRDKNNPIYIAIENKIWAKEGPEQTKKYSAKLEEIKKEEKMGSAWIAKVFLTPDKSEAKDDTWKAMSYKDIDDIITRMVDSRRGLIDPAIAYFISNYQSIIRRYIMGKQDDLEVLCRSFYRKHKKALETINNYKPGMITELKGRVIDLLNDLVNQSEYGIQIINQSGGKGSIEFMSKTIEDKFPDPSEDGKDNKPLLHYYIDFYEYYDITKERNTIKINLYLTTKNKGDTCKNIINHFKTKDPKTFIAATYANAKSVYTYSLVRSVTSDLQTNEEDLLDKLKKDLESKWARFKNDHLPKIENCLSEYDQS
ncbi:MAG: PD-(D/E)XK nuclease family protein [Candidatus Cloacimonetes bacterium]|nr:PD-(D/E)XK nuclease family protein [Candidatus Cloacimonadota bacterium]